jgi:nucleotide-binding universal stress UspA family protein
VLGDAGWETEARIIESEDAVWEVALRAAEEIGASAIVVGALERSGAFPRSLGRQARAMALKTPRPLLALQPDGDAPPDDAPALVAYDGSPAAQHALDATIRLLRRRPVVVATAWQPALALAPIAVTGAPIFTSPEESRRLDDAVRAAAERTAQSAIATLESAGWTGATAEPTEAALGLWQALVAAAERHRAAVVVAGTRGHSRLAAAMVGGVADGLLRHAERPVLLVPPDAGAAAG